MDDVKYTVRINYKNGSHRFVKWCDEHWFETTHEPRYDYTLQEAQRICWLMRKHYVSNIAILGTDGSAKEMGLPTKQTAPKETPKKNMFFSLNKATIK